MSLRGKGSTQGMRRRGVPLCTKLWPHSSECPSRVALRPQPSLPCAHPRLLEHGHQYHHGIGPGHKHSCP